MTRYAACMTNDFIPDLRHWGVSVNNFKRELKLAAPTGTLTVAVTISPPVDRGRYWECQYEIGWPEGKKTSEARGADAVQAIHLAMQAISVHLYASKHHQSGKLYWECFVAGGKIHVLEAHVLGKVEERVGRFFASFRRTKK